MWMRFQCMALVGLAGALACGAVAAQATPQADRGRLLYATHCIACHNDQVHWRDKKLATDWARLKQQVRHWQAAAQLGWTDDDIVAVARHLNETIYRLPQMDDAVGRAAPGESVAQGGRGPR